MYPQFQNSVVTLLMMGAMAIEHILMQPQVFSKRKLNTF